MEIESAKLEIRGGVVYMILTTPKGEARIVSPKSSVLLYGAPIEGPAAEYDLVIFENGDRAETGFSINAVVLSLARNWASGAFSDIAFGHPIPIPTETDADAEQWRYENTRLFKINN